jgi:hypothetical protein
MHELNALFTAPPLREPCTEVSRSRVGLWPEALIGYPLRESCGSG